MHVNNWLGAGVWRFTSSNYGPGTVLPANSPGAINTIALYGSNAASGTNLHPALSNTGGGYLDGNLAVRGSCYSSSAGTNAGVLGYAQNGGTGDAVGGIFMAPFFLGSGTGRSIGVLAKGGNPVHNPSIGGAFGLGSTEALAIESSVILGDSCHFDIPLLTLKNIGVTHLQVNGGVLYLGAAAGLATPVGRAISGEPGLGTDIVGGSLTLRGGISTGAGTPSSIIFKNTTAGASSATPQTEITSLTLAAGGDIQVNNTITPIGTTGAQTINKASGTINIAAAGTSVVLTNSLITANSRVFVTLRTNDATAWVKNVVPAAGSCTITLGAAATGAISLGFLVIN